MSFVVQFVFLENKLIRLHRLEFFFQNVFRGQPRHRDPFGESLRVGAAVGLGVAGLVAGESPHQRPR